LEINRIDHDPTVDRYLDRLSLAHVEGVPSVLAMVNAHQGYKLPTALDEVWLDLVFTRMVFERKGVEEVDPFCATELQNGKLDGGFSKHFAIEIHVATLQVKVFQPVVRRPLFTEIIFDAPRLAGTEASRVHHRIWFEERPEQVVCDLNERSEESDAYTVGLSSLRQIPLTSRRTDLRMSRSPSDLMSTKNVGSVVFLSTVWHHQ